jgi:hypothetical protein
MNYVLLILLQLGVALSILNFTKTIYPLYHEKIKANKKLNLVILVLFTLGLVLNYFWMDFLMN